MIEFFKKNIENLSFYSSSIFLNIEFICAFMDIPKYDVFLMNIQ